jgi:hypothetical protein
MSYVRKSAQGGSFEASLENIVPSGVLLKSLPGKQKRCGCFSKACSGPINVLPAAHYAIQRSELGSPRFRYRQHPLAIFYSQIAIRLKNRKSLVSSNSGSPSSLEMSLPASLAPPSFDASQNAPGTS